MTLKNLFTFLVVVVLTLPVSAQQNPTQADWNHFFNAQFLPENSSESQSAAKRVEHPELKSRVNAKFESAESRVRQQAERAPAAESVQSMNSSALYDMDAGGHSFSAVQLPDLIASAEKSGASEQLNSYYQQYQSDYPLHYNVYEYARHLLNSVAYGGWLVVQGQLDTYPLRALQITEGFRDDVIIVNLNWLYNDATYRSQIASKLAGNLGWTSNDSTEQLVRKLRKSIPGDMYLSMTVSTNLLQSFRSSLQPAGLAFVLSENEPSREKHHEILAAVDWKKVVTPSLPEYVQALQQNYIAALLLDEKLGNPEPLGSSNRGEVIQKLYEQRSLRSAGENYLQSK